MCREADVRWCPAPLIRCRGREIRRTTARHTGLHHPERPVSASKLVTRDVCLDLSSPTSPRHRVWTGLRWAR